VKITSVVTSTPSQQYVDLTASGYVVAQRRAAVASKATGRLVELKVREGSRLRKGDVIARLDASDVMATMAAAQAGVRQAEVGVRQAQVELTNAQSELARSKGLQAQGFISPQAVEVAQTRAKSAKASVQAAQAGVVAAQAQVKVQQVNEDFTAIRAPFDGVVLVKNANVGDIITPFSSAAGSQGAVVTMADMSTLEVEADVSESSVGKTRVGQPVEIVLDALPEVRFRGRVGGIVPTVDRAKATVMTKIRFDQLDERILPEMSAKVNFLSRPITQADQQPVLAVSAQALQDRDGGKVVWRVRVEGSGETARWTVEPVAVKPGRTLGEVVEINVSTAGALKSGDKVVQSPTTQLKPGALVIQGKP
jgi:HlyD family secretion protein